MGVYALVFVEELEEVGYCRAIRDFEGFKVFVVNGLRELVQETLNFD